MAEFNWTVDDIKRAQRDFSNNFMRLDCIRTESYDVAIDCMTECIEKKAADVQPVRHGRWIPKGSDFWLCSNCENNLIYSSSDRDRTEKQRYCCRCGARMDGDTND